jgi:4-nitrophenyl phosphatase
MNLSTLQTLLLDADGVLWTMDHPMPGLLHLFDVINARGVRYALITNNSIRSIQYYVDKLARFGVSVPPELVFSSLTVSLSYLRQHYPPPARLYVIGETGLLEGLRRAGYDVQTGTGDETPQAVTAVVVGLDRALTWEKLASATLLIRDGAAFIGTNSDRSIPTPRGILPGAGAILAALQASTDVVPIVLGKPERAIFEAALAYLQADTASAAMVGDRLETDILGAQRVGLGTILVLSGVTSREALDNHTIRPDMVFDNIEALACALERPWSEGEGDGKSTVPDTLHHAD